MKSKTMKNARQERKSEIFTGFAVPKAMWTFKNVHLQKILAYSKNSCLSHSAMGLLLATVFFATGLLTTSAAAQRPSASPVLRIETGMHTAVITRVGVDAAGRFLVTASHDKTARVWDIATGELLRVLRPPLGAGNEGKLYSVAISPDGNTVAVSGWTSPDGSNIDIYLFDRASGRLVRRFGGLPSRVSHLVFSPNGKRLAATLLRENGIRVYETGGWQQIGVDADYGDDSYGADFDQSGRLVTSCYDGFIRLYAVGIHGVQLLAKKTTSGGKLPYSVKFSPDGGKIAIGFADSTVINVMSVTDLSLLFAPDTGGMKNGDLNRVAWSATGDALYAGGGYQSHSQSPIRFWRDGGRGKPEETIALLSGITDIQPLPNGGVIYAGGDPAWGVIDASGKRLRFVMSGIADYRAMFENFRVSDDGAEIGYGYEVFGRSAARFSLVERRLELIANQKLRPPQTIANNLDITDWKDNYAPKLNGSKLSLLQNEGSNSLAIAPDNLKFLLGTGFRIRLFDRTGEELWNTVAPGEAWSVNISGDGRFAIAAFGDGTIRWYRMTDGAELLAFFPHNDKKRWVLWTPTGYYDASPDAEDLIGWHLNSGKDAAADFFPVGLFRNQFYRPDVISKILSVGDESRALQIANDEAGRKQQQADVAKQLPPVIEIVSPQNGTEVSSSTVKIFYKVRTPSGEAVTNVKVLIDGRPISGERQLVREKDDSTSVSVTIPEQDSEVSIIAENRFAPSVPANVRLKWKGKSAANTDEFVIKPKLYVLAVGVGKYANTAYNLEFPGKDARDFSAAMVKQKGGLYRDVIVKTLTDADATRDNIVDGLDWIRTQTTSKDVAMIFFAGHGVNDTLNRYYFSPHNFNLERQSSTGVGMSDIKATVENIAGKVVLFVDSCHSGNVFGTAKSRDLSDINGFVNELSSAENGAIVFAASTGRQVSLEDAVWNNGAFTKALVEGLSGKAEVPGKGKVTINSLDLYISERVKELTKGRQTPTTAKPNTVPDFPVALKQ